MSGINDDKITPVSADLRLDSLSVEQQIALLAQILDNPTVIEYLVQRRLNLYSLGIGEIDDITKKLERLGKLLMAADFLREIPTLAIIRDLASRISATILPTFQAGPFAIKMGDKEIADFFAFVATKEIPSMFLALMRMEKLGRVAAENIETNNEKFINTSLQESTDQALKAKFNPKVRQGGVVTDVLSTHMTRGFGLWFETPELAQKAAKKLKTTGMQDQMKITANSTTTHGKVIKDLDVMVIENEVYLKLYMHPGDAAGHNMTTRAGTEIGKELEMLLQDECDCVAEQIKFNLVSTNFCSDKKTSLENREKGRGVVCRSQILVPKEVINEIFKGDVTAERIVNEYYHYKLQVPNEIAQVSMNSSIANIAAGMLLAYSQDVANTVEASEGEVHFALTGNGDLWCSLEMMCVVGTVGGGISSPHTKERFAQSNIPEPNGDGSSRQIFAQLIAAVALLYELNIAGSLMRHESHAAAHDPEKQSKLQEKDRSEEIWKIMFELIQTKYFQNQ